MLNGVMLIRILTVQFYKGSSEQQILKNSIYVYKQFVINIHVIKGQRTCGHANSSDELSLIKYSTKFHM